MADNDAATSTAVAGERERRGFFGRTLLFVRQVIDEMRKVVYPTRDELTSFTIAVLVFLAVIMAYVNGLDWMFTRAVSWVFGSG
ncbi:preprotein translocase subunit SecE [Dermacoccus sp. Tok2021]|uniref:preprotein translocase subunit SecE n=1 Tax=Dermacoccus sp. Tok2021 TaxID=2826873 RepID=UPI001CA74345|nr:preprotein translocase subunit SecE [Dermacoccus sp. Tok2021]